MLNCNFKNNKLYIISKNKYNYSTLFIFRTMVRAANGTVNMALIRSKPLTGELSHHVSTRGMAIHRGVKFSSKDSKANLSSDESGYHIHLVKESCAKEDCSSMTCKSLCESQIKKTFVKGHFTGHPPIGKFTRFISDTNLNEESKAQYFVKHNKEVTVDHTNTKAPKSKVHEKATLRINHDTEVFEKIKD